MAHSGFDKKLPYAQLFHFSSTSPLANSLLSLGPEVEARIAKFRRESGPVLFGGRMAYDVDKRLAIPDNMGLYLEEVAPSGQDEAKA